MKKYRKKMIIGSIIAIVLYLLIGSIAPYSIQPEVSTQTKKDIAQKTFTSTNLSPEKAKVIDQNGEALEERIRLIANADEKIILSTYEFRSDESGKDVLSALIDASLRGVQVQVIVDGVGALARMMNNDYFIALSSLENAQIKVYNPIRVYQPWNLMGRMHDKYLLVDDESYILGGRNNYDYFLGDHDGYKNYDWDILVASSKKNSHSIQQLNQYFQSVWNLEVSELYHDDNDEQDDVQEERKELQERYENLQKEHQDWFLPDTNPDTLPTQHIELVSNPIQVSIKEPIVYETLTHLMTQAKQEVKFHTPYIIANEYMLDRIRMVCQKVPQITMMTNSVANNGNPFGAMDYQKHKKKILDTGLDILEYDGGISYHGKCFTIDDHLSAIGSFNWDMRSAYLDTELMIVIDSQKVNASLKEKMTSYEKDALHVIDEDNYDLKESQVPQENSFFRSLQLRLMQLLLGWLRFLM